MIVLELLARIAVGWMVLSVIAIGAYVAAMALRNARRERTQRITPAYPWCVPVRPPVTQADVDATWASVWPSAVDDDELTDLEFTSLISTTWEWPDTAEGAA